MRSYFIISALTIALAFSGSIVPAVGESIVTPTAAQQQTSEIDRTIEEGNRLFKEGSAESLRKSIGQFENALELARLAKAQDKQALSLLSLGRLHSDLGEKQKALKFYNQSVHLWRVVGDRPSEAATLNNIGLVYNNLGEKQKALEYYNQALPLRRVMGTSPEEKLSQQGGEATLLNNIGLVYNDLGEKQKALDYFNQSLSIYLTIKILKVWL